jgi:hypothetical protein
MVTGDNDDDDGQGRGWQRRRLDGRRLFWRRAAMKSTMATAGWATKQRDRTTTTTKVDGDDDDDDDNDGDGVTGNGIRRLWRRRWRRTTTTTRSSRNQECDKIKWSLATCVIF